MGKGLLQHPWLELQVGGAHCVEIFVFDELKINSFIDIIFMPFFSPNILKIHVKNTKKKWVGPIFLRGKRILLCPPTHTPKIVGASDVWARGGIFEIHLAVVGGSNIFHYHWLSFFHSFSFSFSFLLSFSFFFLLFFFFSGSRMRGASATKAPPWTRHCFERVGLILAVTLE